MTEGAVVEILMSVHGCFVVHKVSRSFEAFVAVFALIVFFHLVNIPDVLFKRVLVWRSLSAVFANIFEMLRAVIAQVTIVGLYVSQIVSADFATNPVFVASHVSFQVLFHRVSSAKGFRANLANLGTAGGVGVVQVVFQSGIVYKLLAAVFHWTRELWFDVVEDVDTQQVVADHKLPREALGAMVASLKIKIC